MNHQSSRLFDHVTLKVKDLKRSKEFYRSIVETLGHTISQEHEDNFSIGELLVTQNTEPSQSVHIAFQASNPGVVKLFHETALKCGGQCLRAPQDIPMNQDQYAALVSDPDGNNIEVVYKISRPLNL